MSPFEGIPKTKYGRIKLLEELGYNVPEVELFQNIEDAKKSKLLQTEGKFSVRTQLASQPEAMDLPFHRNLSREEAAALAFNYLNKGFEVLLTKWSWDPRFQEMTGTAMKKEDEVIIEWSDEPGVSVRRVSVENKPTGRAIMKFPFKSKDPRLVEIAEKVYNFPIDGMVLEWAYYAFPVGVRKEKLLFFGFYG